MFVCSDTSHAVVSAAEKKGRNCFKSFRLVTQMFSVRTQPLFSLKLFQKVLHSNIAGATLAAL